MTEKKKNVHAGHRGRMRERFQISGFDNYQPHEVLEMLLFEFIPVINTNPIGHYLIERFGTVKGVLTATYDELVKVSGIGPKTAEGILSVYPTYSVRIRDWFRQAGALTRYDIAFLADWFMDWMPHGSIGILICDHDRRFLDFTRMNVNRGDLVFDLGAQIVKSARGQEYILLVKEDYSLVTREMTQMLRAITGRGHAYLLDACVLEGYKPVSILYLT